MKAVVYTKTACPFCIAAIQLLERKNVPYEEIDVGNEENKQLLLEVLPHVKSVPQIFIDGQYIGNYEQLKEMFNNDDGRVLLLE